ncbi:MAG: hypothetical protein FWD71_13210 [Oscillospiraceae bacterium]|nr:hypothetical protein [Oscillospiraceae bacterium]
MNTRERFVRVLTGKDVDRVPFMKIFGGTNAVTSVWLKQYPAINTYIDDLLGFEGCYRGWQITPVNMGLCGVPPDVVEYSSETETRVRHGDGSVSVHMNRDGHFFNHTVEFPVKCHDDWRRIKDSGWLNPDDPRRFPVGWKHYARIFNSRDYPLQLTCGGVYGFARGMLGDETLCIMMYEEPELVSDIISTYIEMCISIWKKMVVDVQFDIIECWEDMAYKSGSIISKHHFTEFLAPQYRRIRDFAGNAGIPLVMVDNDGNIMELSEWMSEAGVNCMYPFEVQSGNDILQIREHLPDMSCIGGLDKECMARDKYAMDAELEKARRLIPLGKFIPGPDHFVLENVPFENYEYFMRGLKRMILETKL